MRNGVGIRNWKLWALVSGIDRDTLSAPQRTMLVALEELVSREINRDNPFADESPCVVAQVESTTCKWGTRDCVASHSPAGESEEE